MNKIPILYNCFLNSSGYSQAAQNYILALHNSGKYDIKVEIFGGRPTRPAVSDEKYELFMRMKNKPLNENAIQILHCIPTMQKRVKKLKKNIAFATFETFEPPSKWIDILNTNNAIIAPSQFNYRIFAHAKIKKPIFYWPHCLDTNMYNENTKPLKTFDKFTFLFMGTWKVRKGYQQLIEAWLKNFKEEDNVQLLIKTDKVQKARVYIDKIKKQFGIIKGFAPILFETQVFDESVLPRFIKSFNCLILPTMGEGFNICGLQCMALKIPVIITDFSGCQDYANNNTAILLKPSGFVLKNDMDGIPQFRNKKWAFVTVKDIVESIKYIISRNGELIEKTNMAYDNIMKNFNYNKIEDLFSEIIGSLYN